MSTIPTLALIPSGVKASKVYSVLPTDGTGDFTFSRAGALPSFNATRVNKDGLIEQVLSNVPRLNYPMIDGVVSGCPSLLLEPQRTNLVTYSEDLTQWSTNENAEITSNNIISPDGTLNADKFEFTADGKIRPNNSQLTFVDNYAFSIFIKKGNSRYVTLSARFFTSSLAIGFDLDTETSQSGGIIEKYTNDWYRLSITNNVTGDADKTGVFYVYLPNSLGSETSVSGNYAYAWGAQVEEGSYSTSYIPTQGSTVTRVAETANGAGDANTFNDSEGVLFAEFSLQEGDNETRQLSISDGTDDENIKILQLNGSTIRIEAKMSAGTNFVKDVLIDAFDINKFAIQYKANEYKVFVNGVNQSVVQRSTTPTGLNSFNFDRGDGASDFYGNVKQIQYFDTALTDQELQQLTSL